MGRPALSLLLCLALVFSPALPALATDFPEQVTYNTTGTDSTNSTLHANGTTFTVNDGVTYTLSGRLSGSSNLIKTGSGTLVLGNTNNTYTGATIVSGGTLNIAGYRAINPDAANQVTDGGTLDCIGQLSVGLDSSGSLAITGGGVASATTTIYVGDYNDSNGTVTVDGSGSKLNATDNLYVGALGTGTLTIKNGGTAASSESRILIGYGTTSTGTVTVSGANSKLQSRYGIILGRETSGGTALLAGTGSVIANENGAAYNVTVYDRGTLSAGDSAGSIGTLTIGSASAQTNLVLNTGSVLEVDVAANNSSDRIVVNGEASVTSGKIDITSWQTGTYTILTATGGITGSDSMTVTLNGAVLGSRQDADLTGSTANALILALSTDALAMTWAGPAGNTWSSGVQSDTFWKRDDNSVSAYFINNDSVTFGTTGAGAVNVAAGGVTVASTGAGIPGMKVTADGYTFAGGAITGDTLSLAATGASSTIFQNEINFTYGINVDTGNTLVFDYASTAHPTGVINSNAISGGGNLTKSGDGVLTLTGANIYNGTTTISGGTLQIGDGTSGSLGGGSYDGAIVNNGALVFNQSTAQTLSGAISGTGSLTKQGGGILTLAGTNTYAGNTTVSGGTLTVSGNLGNGNYTGAIVNNGALVFNQSTAQTLGSVISGTGSLTKQGSGTLTLTSTNTYSGGTTVTGGLINFTTGSLGTMGTVTLNGGGLQWAGSNTTDLSGRLAAIGASGATFDTGGNNVAFATALTGTGAITKDGLGKLTLSAGLNRSAGSAANAGDLTVNKGTLTIAGQGNYARNVVVNTDGTLSLEAGASAALSATILAFDGSGGLDIAGTASDGVTLITTTGGVTGFNPNNVTVSGSAGVDYLSLSAEAANSNKDIRITTALVWNQTNGDQHGTFTQNNTSLPFTVGQALADNLATNTTGWDGKSLTKAGAGTLVLTGANTYTGDTTISGGTLQIGNGTSGSLGNGNYTGAISNTGALVFNQSTAQTLGGVISGTGALTKQGTGVLTLTGDNSYSGGTTLTAGTLSLGHNTALGTGALSMASGTTLGFSADGLSVNNNIATTGSFTVNTGTNSATLGGDISDTGSLNKQGSGTLTLTGTNTYSGGTTVNAGTLSIGSDDNIGGGTNTLSGGGLNLGGGATYAKGWTLAGAGNTIGVAAGSATMSGALSGTGGFSKTGAGTLTLTGANTHSGGATVSGGALQIGDGGTSGSLAGNIAVNTGAALVFNRSDNITHAGDITGSGSVRQEGSGVLTVSGNIAPAFTLASGTLAGTGSLGQVTLAGGTTVTGGGVGTTGTLRIGNGGTTAFSNVTYALDIASGNASDKIAVNGGVDFSGGGNTVSVASFLKGQYTIMDWSGTLAGGAANFSLSGFTSNARQDAELTIDNGKLILSMTADNKALTWTGTTDAVWVDGNDTKLNWDDGGGNIFFINDDSVTFDSTGIGQLVVAIDNAGVTVNAMTVNTDGYVFDGGTITGSSLSLNASATFKNKVDFTNGISVATGNTLTFEYGSGITANSNTLSGAGNLVKDGTGTLSLGGFNLTGSVAVTAGALQLNKTGAYTFNNALSGSGTLAFDLGAANNALSFGATVGNGFTGTVELVQGSLNINDSAASVLTNAGLQLDSGATAVVGNSRTINDLTFNGGALAFQAFDGSGSISPDTLLTVDDLAVNAAGGTIKVDIASLNGITTSAADYATFYDYAGSGANLYQKQIVAATSVTETGSLTLLDSASNTLSGKAEVRDITDGSGTVGKATFDYTASVLNTASDKGIYLGYGLSQLEALAGKVVLLDTTDSTAANPAISAKLTGAGGFTFSGSNNAEVGNAASDYTGATIVDGLTVTMTANNAFGATSSLALQNNGAVNMDGKAQTVGALSGGSGTEIKLGTLTVNQNADTGFDGLLSNSGTGNSLIKQGTGTLTLTGANTYTGGSTVNAGALRLTNADAAGTGTVSTATDTALELAFNGAFSNAVTGSGGLNADAGAGNTVTLAGTNSYTGLTTVRSGSLALGSDLTASTGLTLYSGTTFKRGAFAHDLSGKSLTTWDNATYDGDLDATGATLNFISTASTVTGSMLGVSGNADVTGAFVNLGVAGNANLDLGSTISLLKTTGTLTATGVTQGDGTGAILAGATVVYDISLTALPNELQATVQSGAATEGAKALSEGFLGGVTLTLQGADLAAGQGLDAAVQAARNSAGTGPGGYGLGGFATTSGGSVRYNTGSYVDMNSMSVLTGLALGADLAPGRLTVGAFFEYGNGSYDTHNSFSNAASVDGDGSTHYMGGGVLGRMDFKESGPGHVYTEASARAGRLHNDYRSSDLRDSNGRKADYDSSSNYYGLHLGTGYVWNITDSAALDLHAKYFWTRQEGDSVSLSTGESVRFKDVDSHRVRLGSRFGYTVNEYVTPYVGAAWEYEFDGKARATTNGFGIDAPDLKGSTGIGELGLSVKPSQTLPLTFDLGVQGYTGKREGVTGSLQIKFEF